MEEVSLQPIDQILSVGVLHTIDRLGEQVEDLSMGGYQIINLGDPVEPNDAVNKSYADSLLSLSEQKSNLSMNGYKITNLSDPTESSDAATKNYVDLYAQGIQYIEEVKTKTVNALSGSPVYDNGTNGIGATLTAGSGTLGDVGGYTVQVNDRILVDSQADAKQNGVYIATSVSAPYVLTRTTDLDGAPINETKVGTIVLVTDGDFANNRYIIANKNSQLSNPPNVTIGVDDLIWVRQGGGNVSLSSALNNITTAGTLANNQVYLGNSNNGLSKRTANLFIYKDPTNVNISLTPNDTVMVLNNARVEVDTGSYFNDSKNGIQNTSGETKYWEVSYNIKFVTPFYSGGFVRITVDRMNSLDVKQERVIDFLVARAGVMISGGTSGHICVTMNNGDYIRFNYSGNDNRSAVLEGSSSTTRICIQEIPINV